MSTKQPLKIVGKEFLLDEDLLISNYNPFVTGNGNLSDLYNDTTLTGKLYLFSKNVSTEPTKEAFRNIKTLSELAFTENRYINVSFDVTYDKTNSIKNIKIKSNLINSTDATINLTNVGDILESTSEDNNYISHTFAILVLNASTTKIATTTWTDLTLVQQSNMWLIPSKYIGITSNANNFNTIPELKNKPIKLLKNELILNINDIKFESTSTEKISNIKLLPNKLNYRLREELFKNLLVKSTNPLIFNEEAIKFKDPVTNEIITLNEVINPRAISRLEKIFLEWISILATENGLSEYNKYFYSNSLGGLNSGRTFDINIVPHLMDIICSKYMYNINLNILSGYLIINPLSLYGLDLKLISEGFQPEDFDLAKILYTMYIFDVKYDLRTPLTYTTSGLVLPSLTNINVGRINKKFDYFFFPQKNKYGLNVKDTSINSELYNLLNVQNISSNLLNFPSSTTTEINFLGDTISSGISPDLSCTYTKTTDTNLIKDINTLNAETLTEYKNGFSWFVGINGSNSNDGKTPQTPKLNFVDIPAGEKVLLLEGNYTDVITKTLVYKTFYFSCFEGLNDHHVYGCFDLTILDRTPAQTTSDVNRDKPVFDGINSNFNIYNMKVLYNCDSVRSGVNYSSALCRNNNGNNKSMNFVNVNFVITGYTYAKSYNINPIFTNCKFSGGTLLVDYGVYSTTQTKTIINLLGYASTTSLYKYIQNMLPLINSFNKKVYAMYKFKPRYTLIPIGTLDGDNEDHDTVIDSIQIMDNLNATKISNFGFKI